MSPRLPPISNAEFLEVVQLFLPSRLAKAAEAIDRQIRDNWLLYSIDYDRAVFVRPKPDSQVVVLRNGFFCSER